MSSEPKHMLSAPPQDGDNMALTGAGREAVWEKALSLQRPWAGQAAAGTTLCDLLLGSVGQGRGAEAGYLGGMAHRAWL